MKSSGVIALVAAGVVAGGGIATYELTKPSGSVRVNYVDPAATTSEPTVEPTTATVTVTPTATVTKAPVAVTSSSTTRKATVRKEATVTTSDPSTTTAPQGGLKPPPKAPPRPPGETPGATGAFGPGQSGD